MGIVKRNLDLENHLDEIQCDWSLVTDAQYKEIFAAIHEFLDSDNYTVFEGDDAFRQLKDNLPLDGYIISLSRSKFFNIYISGGPRNTFAYQIKRLQVIDRETLNWIECVITNSDLSFACGMNHEWQAHCPETFYEKNA